MFVLLSVFKLWGEGKKASTLSFPQQLEYANQRHTHITLQFSFQVFLSVSLPTVKRTGVAGNLDCYIKTGCWKSHCLFSKVHSLCLIPSQVQLGFNSNLTDLKKCLCYNPPHRLCLAFTGQEKINNDSTDETSEKMHFTTRVDKFIFLIGTVSRSWLVCGCACSYFFN